MMYFYENGKKYDEKHTVLRQNSEMATTINK